MHAHVICYPFLKTVLFLVFLTSCAKQEVIEPGRGAAKEEGPQAKVYPVDAEARIDRHGLWRGKEGERTVWEVRYTRGVPTGPYREWDEQGNLRATWPYNWEGKIEGWARWYEAGEPSFKLNLAETQPDFDPIGQADQLETWAKALEQSLTEKPEESE